MRQEGALRQRASSSARAVMRLTRVPGSGKRSKRTKRGVTVPPETRERTLWLANVASMRSAWYSSRIRRFIANLPRQHASEY